MKINNSLRTTVTTVLCAIAMSMQAQTVEESNTVKPVAADTVNVEKAETATPKRPFEGLWMIYAESEVNNCEMDINFYEKQSRKTVNDGEETTMSCYGVIHIGNAAGSVPDYCTILTAEINGSRATITFKSSRDSNTYSADLVSPGRGSSITVENIKLRKVVWSPMPQTMLKNGMVFNYAKE